MLDDVMAVTWPRSRDALLDRRRAEEIVRRVRVIALAFAALTIAWVPIDIAVFSAVRWHDLVIVRAAAALALLLLAMASRASDATPAGARVRLFVLFAIPALFFVAALEIFADTPRRQVANAVAAAYSFVPFLLAAGIATFPLALVESIGLAAIAAAAEAWAFAHGTRPFEPFAAAQAYWLLDLIAAVSAVSAATQLRMLRALVEQAVRDPLTGCLRRSGGEALLEQQFRFALRHGTPLTVLFADIDRFKAVNDRHGHDAGDRVLAEVAATFRDSLRESDVPVRWGGEEFVVVLPQADAASTSAFLERLRARGFGVTPAGEPITVSIGIATYPGDAATSAHELVGLADQRMYAAKQAGRNAWVESDGIARPILVRAEGQAYCSST